MPPKPKYSKEELLQEAIRLVKEEGIDALSARTVSQRLNASAASVFTHYSSMEELKAEVRELAGAEYYDYLNMSLDYSPAFKEFGIRMVDYAVMEPNVFKMLFMDASSGHNLKDVGSRIDAKMVSAMIREIVMNFGVSEEDAMEIFNQMIIYGVGIINLLLNDRESFSREFVNESISNVCVGLVMRYRLSAGTLDEESLMRFSMVSPDFKPEKR